MSRGTAGVFQEPGACVSAHTGTPRQGHWLVALRLNRGSEDLKSMKCGTALPQSALSTVALYSPKNITIADRLNPILSGTAGNLVRHAS